MYCAYIIVLGWKDVYSVYSEYMCTTLDSKFALFANLWTTVYFTSAFFLFIDNVIKRELFSYVFTLQYYYSFSMYFILIHDFRCWLSIIYSMMCIRLGKTVVKWFGSNIDLIKNSQAIPLTKSYLFILSILVFKAEICRFRFSFGF